MQYLIFVIEAFPEAGRRSDSAGSATAAEQEAIETFNAGMIAAGQWLFAGGLSAPAGAHTVDGRPGGAGVVDGPLFPPAADTHEHFGGFWLVEVPDAEAAHELAARASAACNRRVEVRALL